MDSQDGELPEIGHYRFIRLLGRGAMGEVWLAEDTQLPRKVAVKLLPEAMAEDHAAVARLMREAQAAASVDHPAVVTVHEAGVACGRPFLVMQHVEGETLAARLGRGPVSIAEALAIVKALADALAEVHALGIVHRDLKPGNIMLTARGPKILDFGVASLHGSPQLTATGAFIGTPLAMSPEQVRGHGVDARSDLWALGVIFYELLTGVSPFAGETVPLVGFRIMTEQPAPPSKLRGEVGPALDRIVLRLLRKDPAERYARAEDLLAELGAVDDTQLARPSPSPAPPATPRVAVTAFEVLSGAPEDAFLAAGLTDDLIVDLTRVGGVRVASREDVRPYRDRPVPPRTLARELGVDYVILGSVRRADRRARISAQLVCAGNGMSIWAERFDRNLDDLFAVQAEVSRRIVEALKVTLAPGEGEMLDRPPSKSAEAYALYLRARDLVAESRDDNLRAEALLARAVELDPDFALAHAALGECFARRGLNWWAGLETADRAMPEARRALELEPDLFEAHLVVAMVHRLRGERTELLGALRRVIEMNPDHAEACRWAAWSLMSLGRPEEAVSVLERIAERNADVCLTLSALSNAYEMLGRPAEVTAIHKRIIERAIEELARNPGNPALLHVHIAISLIHEGEVERGIAQVERAVAAGFHDGRIRYNAACAFARAGLHERALRELREGVASLPTYLSDWPRRDPDLAALHDDPEFIRLFGRSEPT